MQPDQLEAIRNSIRWSPYAWGGTVAALATIYIIARLGSWLAIAVASWPLWRYRGDSWSERARRAWPSRRMSGIAMIVMGGGAIVAFARPQYRLQILSPVVLMATASVVAIWGVLQTAIRRESRLNPAYSLTPMAARGARISWLLVIAPIFLGTVVLDFILPDQLNSTAIMILVAVAVSLGSYLAWGRLGLMRSLGIIRPASERLRTIVQRASGNSGTIPREVVEMGLPMANAFAFPLQRMVGMTDASMAVLDDEEIATVCTHELAHLREPRLVVWARAARVFLIGVCAAILVASARPLPGSFGPMAVFVGVYSAVIIFLLGTVLFNRLSLKMEHRADAQAAQSQESPGVYARALEKLYRTNLVPAVFRSKRMTHPHLYDRMIQAGVEPEYARPAAPSQWAALLGLATLALAALLGIFAYRFTTSTLPDALLEHKAAILWRIGAGEQDSQELGELLVVPSRDGPSRMW